MKEINDELLAEKENARIVGNEKEKLEVLCKELKEKLQEGKINR